MEKTTIEKIGPGIWYLIHKESLVCEPKKYIDFIYRLYKNFPCKACKQHFERYLQENPPEEYLTLQYGLFIWSWKFHNLVNKRLGKPVISFDTALEMYTNEKDCNMCMKLEDKQSMKLELLYPQNMIKKKKQKIKFVLRDL